jgi:hypothetical protein
MTLGDRDAASRCRSRSVRYPATLLLDLLCSARRRLSVLEDRVAARSFSYSSRYAWWASAVGRAAQGQQRRRPRHRPCEPESCTRVGDPSRGRSRSRWPVRALGRRHATTSSNASPPRLPAITIERKPSTHVSVPRIGGWPANTPYRSQIGPSSAHVSSSRAVDRSTSTSFSPSSRLRSIVSTLPPAPARPENGTTAIVAPRRSSFSHTSSCSSSPRARRNRAACGRDASRPDGVRHISSGIARHVGHERLRQPRAT